MLRKKLYALFILLPCVFLISSKSFTQTVSSGELDALDKQIGYLLSEHQKHMNRLFPSMTSKLDTFERTFFSDFTFMNHAETRGFFNTVMAKLAKGMAPQAVYAFVAYSSISSINGKVTGVNYEYRSDGKNVTLIKGTYNNGNLVKAVYNYNITGKQLKADEYKDDRVINSNIHVIRL